jgi:hypothetical protein
LCSCTAKVGVSSVVAARAALASSSASSSTLAPSTLALPQSKAAGKDFAKDGHETKPKAPRDRNSGPATMKSSAEVVVDIEHDEKVFIVTESVSGKNS